MKVLVACEFSSVVSKAFAARGHYVVSCDLLEAEDAGAYSTRSYGDMPKHYKGDVRDIIGDGWDLMIAHPPCTHLAVSGARWFNGKEKQQEEALEFVQLLLDVPIPRICVENPVSIISSRIRKPDQIVQPWMFGDEATKTTCLWLKGLPLLRPTNVVDKGARHTTKSGRSLPKWYNLPPSPDRAKIRSRTFEGFANAMAEQWGSTATETDSEAVLWGSLDD